MEERIEEDGKEHKKIYIKKKQNKQASYTTTKIEINDALFYDAF